MSTSTEGTSFSDECRAICLYYLKHVSSEDRDFEREDQVQFHRLIGQQIENVDTDIDDCDSIAQSLKQMSLNFEITMIGKVANSVKMIWHCDINDLNLGKAANTLLEESPVRDWNDVALLLHLIYRTTRVRDIEELDEIINQGVSHLEDVSFEFISKSGGWSSVMNQEDEPTEQEEILSSIVMVPQDESDVSQSATPPMMLPPLNDYEERDSLSSATPPEIVDRPPMTASLIQMMGDGDASSANNGNTGASSDSIDFEMVGSVNSAVDSTPNSPPVLKEKEENTKESEPVLNKQSVLSQLKSLTGSASVSNESESPDEVLNVSDYIPQITIGVAAAAACIGFIIFKKAS